MAVRRRVPSSEPAYLADFVVANIYIVDWLTRYRGFGSGTALALLLVASGLGIAFYVIGGALGERFGRQRILVGSAFCTLALTIGFSFARPAWLIWLLYILLYQASNGTWSGVATPTGPRPSQPGSRAPPSAGSGPRSRPA